MPKHSIESVSLPIASRLLGRSDESWLIQVLVRLRVIETHLALYSPRKILQVDHLQNTVFLGPSEIDALFLAIEESEGQERTVSIVTFEAKGRRDDILEDQIIHQVQAVVAAPSVTQDWIIPMAARSAEPSEIYVIEFEAVQRRDAPSLSSLTRVSEALYELKPPVPGIGL